MKLKMRLIIAFITVITLPVFLTSLAIVGFGQYQIKAIRRNLWNRKTFRYKTCRDHPGKL